MKREPDLFFLAEEKKRKNISSARAHIRTEWGHIPHACQLKFALLGLGFFFCRYNSCHWQCRHWRRRFPSLKKSFQITHFHGACFFFFFGRTGDLRENVEWPCWWQLCVYSFSALNWDVIDLWKKDRLQGKTTLDWLMHRNLARAQRRDLIIVLV